VLRCAKLLQRGAREGEFGISGDCCDPKRLSVLMTWLTWPKRPTDDEAPAPLLLLLLHARRARTASSLA
jgi:hypothetical protein